MNIFTCLLAFCLLALASGIRGPRLPDDFTHGSQPKTPNMAGNDGLVNTFANWVSISARKARERRSFSKDVRGNGMSPSVPSFVDTSFPGNGTRNTSGIIDTSYFSNGTFAGNGTSSPKDFPPPIPSDNATFPLNNATDTFNGTVYGNTTAENNATVPTNNATDDANGTVHSNATTENNATTLPPHPNAPSSNETTPRNNTERDMGKDGGVAQRENGTTRFNDTSDEGSDHSTGKRKWSEDEKEEGMEKKASGTKNEINGEVEMEKEVEGRVSGTKNEINGEDEEGEEVDGKASGTKNEIMGKDEETAASIGKSKDFDEKKFVEENVDDFSDVPIPNPCPRGFRQVKGQCAASLFERDEANNIKYPVCDEDFHCPINAICDPDQELCRCVHGQPLDQRICEGSSLGGRCDENVNCKSWDHVCNNGSCDCLPGHHREKNLCTRFLDLDNDCTLKGTPCFGEHVGCLDSRGRECPVNATCACRCQLGFEKDEKKKICFKPVPPTKRSRSDNEVVTTTTKPPPTITTTRARGRASNLSFSSFYFLFGLVLLRGVHAFWCNVL